MRIALIIPLFLLIGCDRKEEMPEGLLDRETFTQVLTEAQVIEARVNQELVIEKRSAIAKDRYYEEIFERYNTDEEQFKRTFEFYSERPEELRAIYEEVLTELSRRKDLVPAQDTSGVE